MTVAVPYWWSKSCYDICNDEVRGGWRCLWLRIVFQRGFQAHNSVDPRWRFALVLDVGRGAIFPKVS